MHISWVNFLVAISYAAALAGLGLFAAAGFYFHRRLKRGISDAQPVEI
jgi:hypothetical protein